MSRLLPPRGLAAVGVVAVLGLTAIWYSATRSDSDPPAEVTVDCPSDVSLSSLGRLDPADPRLSPFADGSVWKGSVTTQPTSADQQSEMTAALRATVGGDDGLSIHGWVNSEQYSMPVVQAGECDPLVTFATEDASDEIPSETYRVPADARPAQGEDRHLLVIQPDGVTVVEIFAAEKVSDDVWKAHRVEIVDLRGDGLGPDNGVRAYGGSALGGLVRSWEIDPTDPSYTDGVIDHPLALALPSSMLRYDGGDPGYDADGFGTATGYVWPATEQDYDSPWSYGGDIPMGAKVVLPASVDIASLQLGPAATSIARALQDHGAYVTDRTANDTVSFYAEYGAPADWLQAVRGPDDSGEELDRIRERLVVVIEQAPGSGTVR